MSMRLRVDLAPSDGTVTDRDAPTPRAESLRYQKVSAGANSLSRFCRMLPSEDLAPGPAGQFLDVSAWLPVRSSLSGERSEL